MSQNIRTRSKTIKLIEKQVSYDAPNEIIEIIADQMERARDAKTRIKEEGLVVRDMKGSVIPHPAIKIEIDASKMIADLLHKNK